MGAIIVGSGAWNPSGALPQAPVNTVAPSFTGVAQAGQTLTGADGTWLNTVTSTDRQWQRSDTGTGGWTDIAGATGSTYVLQTGDATKYVRFGVRKIGPGGTSAWAYSSASAQIAAAGSLPLLYESNVTGAGRYLGAFRVPTDPGLANPRNWSGGDGASPGAGGFWFNPAGNGGAGSLIVAGRNVGPSQDAGAYLTEISVPDQATWAASGNPSNGQRASFLVPSPYFFDLTNGQSASVATQPVGDGMRSGGAFIHNGNLYQNTATWYQAESINTKTHFKRTGTAVNGGASSGPFAFANSVIDTNGWTWQPPNEGGASGPNVTATPVWYRGPNALVPSEWQAAFGGPMLQGQTQYSQGLPMGCGPALWAFNPDDIGVVDPVPVNLLLGYTPNNALGTLLQGVISASGWVRGVSALWGIAFPPGSGTVLLFTTAGLGTTSYGTEGLDTDPGTGQPIFDPANAGGKGWHAWPYRIRVLAYRASELAEVKANTRAAYNPRPYTEWTLDMPGLTYTNSFDGYHSVAFDAVSRRLFVMERETSRSNFDPIIHVWQLSY